MDLGEFGEEGVTELERLQSITTTTAERYSDEGVTTILQLAYADPVAHTIRTSFGFSYVVDCVSQALAWIYFEDDLKKMRKYSLREVQEIANLIDELNDGNRMQKARAKLMIEQLATELKVNPQILARTVREVHGDPYTQFLCNVWQ